MFRRHCSDSYIAPPTHDASIQLHFNAFIIYDKRQVDRTSSLQWHSESVRCVELLRSRAYLPEDTQGLVTLHAKTS